MGARRSSGVDRVRYNPLVKTKALILSLLLFLLASSHSQQTLQWFPSTDLMTIGVYYYPEAWPESQWPRDVANIKKMGLEFVHMGEFAWTFMEPEEGKLNLEWLDRVVDLSAKQGLKVILCTPSATPPVWLVRQHPEVLMVDARGRRMEHGSRSQACWSQERYREYVGKIVTALAQRYGKNPAVWGWQLDNELSHYDRRFCYCDACQVKFRTWLRQKYGSIENLNRDWGNAFWSQMYQNFGQIRIPNQEELVATVNPHAQLDFQRWFAAEAADYIRFQTGLLRKDTRNQWITTNYMHMHGDVDPSLSRRDLDVMTWTHYPVHGEMGPGTLGFRLGDGAAQSYYHDYMRPMNGLQGIMELQPGQVNWGEVNPQPLPGAIHMWLMRAFAGGARLVCTYRYRQPLFGNELYHHGLVGTDGVTPSVGGREYTQAMEDMKLLRKNYRPGAAMPAAYAARRSAILYNPDNRWDIDIHKQATRWDTMGHVLKYYRGLKSLGAPVDVINEDRLFSTYAFLIAPAYQLVDQELVAKWTRYAQEGGHLVLTARTGQKDRRGQLYEMPWAGMIRDLIGARIPSYDLLPGSLTGKVQSKGKTYEWGSWADHLEPAQGTSVLATYADQFYAGTAAAVTRKLGRGSVTYVGVDTLQGDLERDILRSVFQAANVAVQNFPDQFLVDWRDGFWVATNFTSVPQTAPLSAQSKILTGTREVPPGGVTIWMEP